MYLQSLIPLLSFFYVVFSKTNCPSQCTCKQNNINCSNRSLISLNALDLQSIYLFDYIDVSYNHLSRLPWIQIKFINASHNIIQDAPNIGEGVEYLALKQNKLRYASLPNCPASLKTLDLSENPINDLNLGCVGLTVLDLSHCDIEVLPEKFLDILPSLQVLNIGNNPVKKITDNLSSVSLLELRAEKTHLRFIKQSSLSGLSNLKFLDLSGNRHLHVLNIMATPEIIIARDCSIEVADLTNMPNLRIAVLNNNRINEISFLESLKELYAKNNMISEISMSNLKKADLSYNSLSTLKLSPMDYLNISGNPLQYIRLTTMESLDASHCQLRNIDSSGVRIHMLNLSHNALEHFPPGISAKVLDVSFNRISSFRMHITGIEEINLSGNRLVLAEDVFPQGMMFLGDNPWTCDCKMDQLYKIARDAKALICSHPRNVSGKTWSEACYQSRIPRWMLKHPYLPFIICVGLLFVAMFFFYWIRKKLDSPVPRHEEEDRAAVETVLPQVRINDQLPSYEEALLMPGVMRKVNVVTQTRSYEVLSRRLSSNSI